MSDQDDCNNPCGGPGPTLCDLYTGGPNEWIESGVCMLDNLRKDQVIYIIERNPKARDDLKKVTSCQELIDLVDQVTLLPDERQDDAQQSAFNRADCLPQYTVFRGNNNNH